MENDQIHKCFPGEKCIMNHLTYNNIYIYIYIMQKRRKQGAEGIQPTPPPPKFITGGGGA